MLCQQCWSNTAQEYCLVNVAQIRLGQHYTRNLVVQCWPKVYRHVFTRKPVVVSSMSRSLFLNRVNITVQSWVFLFNLSREFIYSWWDNFEQGPTLKSGDFVAISEHLMSVR